jgi:hypothetical protein
MDNEEDLTILQGSRYFLVISSTVEWLTDLTGYSARGMIRESRTGPQVTLLADLTTFLSVDVPNHQVVLDLDADESSAWTWTHGAYDIEVYPPGDESKAVRILQGKVVLDKEVTHP